MRDSWQTETPPELTYFPVLADAADATASVGVGRVLIVGSTVPEGVEEIADVRLRESVDVLIPTGTYRFADELGWCAMVVLDGAAPGAPVSMSWSAPDDHPLLGAYAWFEEWWPSGQKVPRPQFAIGETVLVLHPDRARGLEFDGVVVVEPVDFPQNVGRDGVLYASLTRATKEPVVVHAKALPKSLRPPK